MDREQRIGSLKCRTCFVTFQSNIHQLSDAVDVYYEWIDASEDTRHEQRPGSKRPNNRIPGGSNGRGGGTGGGGDGGSEDHSRYRGGSGGHSGSFRNTSEQHFDGYDEDDEFN
ncbi:2601_t:CDS:2 [Ambispora gerdemannii]|uniref:Transcription elongation factor 1 homolog n=1 Tax=Ambispora gerdemannii TaxID=144530 RepID=A0A9N8WRF4_9GLOM|nr:2601_t:CDS:2 [Ambispora gerdemannii]